MTTHTRLDTRTARLKLRPQGKPYRTKIGDRIEVVFDMEKTHLFDKETEQALY